MLFYFNRINIMYNLYLYTVQSVFSFVVRLIINVLCSIFCLFNCHSNMPPKRKYNGDYIKFGFTDIVLNKEVRPQCTICTTVLSNDALKPAKWERHLKTVHSNFRDRPREFFEGKKKNLKAK